MGRPRKNQEAGGDEIHDETSPRYRNLAKLAEEDRERKANKAAVVSRTVEMAISSSNRRKYREILRLENGNVYRRIISKKDYEDSLNRQTA